ncbi:DNA topoisomerase 2 [Tanacetum coccineum]
MIVYSKHTCWATFGVLFDVKFDPFTSGRHDTDVHYNPPFLDDRILDQKGEGHPIPRLLNKEFKQYAIGCLSPKINSIKGDGLKPHERKILFYALKKPIIQDVEGVKDHADVTLLFTRLSPITRYLFHKDDELLLRNYLNEDGQSIEPAWFIPIIPMVLVNGSEARGAWSSFIPNYNPRDIIANLIRLLEGVGLSRLLCIVWRYASPGVGKDIKYYKACNDDDTRVHFEITMTKDQMNKARQEEGELWNKLKLTTTLSTANMYVLDAQSKLKKYDTPEKLLEVFYRFRLHLYEKRKTSLPHELIALIAKQKPREGSRAVSGGKGRNPPKEEDEDVAVKGYDGYDYLISQLDDIFEPEYIEELEEERKQRYKVYSNPHCCNSPVLWLSILLLLMHNFSNKNYPEAKYTEAEKKARAKRA